jgi:hypothetical protein
MSTPCVFRGIAWMAALVAPAAIAIALPATAVYVSAPSGCRYEGQVIVPACPNLNCPPGQVPVWSGSCVDPNYAVVLGFGAVPGKS